MVVAVLAALALVGVLYSRWHQYGFQWSVFASSFSRLSWGWIAGAYLLILGTYWGRALRWAVMLRPLKPRPRLWGLFSATAIGFTAVILLGRPGEIVRPYLIARKEEVPLSSQLAAWFLERICDLLAVCLIFGFTLTQISSTGPGIGGALRWALDAGGLVLGIAATTCIVVLFLLRSHSERLRARLLAALAFLPPRYKERVDRAVTAFIDGASSTKDQNSAVRLALYTVLEWTIIALGFVCLFEAYGLNFRVRDVMVFLGFVCFGSLVQIPGIGGGMQIVSVLVLTEIYRLPLELATSVAVTVWLITFVGIVPLGLFLALQEGFSWRKWKDLKEEAARGGEPGFAK